MPWHVEGYPSEQNDVQDTKLPAGAHMHMQGASCSARACYLGLLQQLGSQACKQGPHSLGTPVTVTPWTSCTVVSAAGGAESPMGSQGGKQRAAQAWSMLVPGAKCRLTPMPRMPAQGSHAKRPSCLSCPLQQRPAALPYPTVELSLRREWTAMRILLQAGPTARLAPSRVQVGGGHAAIMLQAVALEWLMAGPAEADSGRTQGAASQHTGRQRNLQSGTCAQCDQAATYEPVRGLQVPNL